ncbi:MAG: hypothetical protein AMK70_04450 [Nitrospira bacterium SG8_35_1]|nr:MAG: hypothetical protein AMK70_04450 [Nitrospira bacterium SG8_35_1]
MKNMLKIFGIVVAAVMFLSVGPVHATPSIMISDGATTLTIVDGGVGDFSPNAGEIIFSGSIGIFDTNIVTGVTMPKIGGASFPIMDLSALEVNSFGGNGTLSIMFSEVGFGPLGSGLNGFVTSVSNNTLLGSSAINFSTYYDASNTLFGQASQLANLSLASSGTASASSFVLPSDPFSLTSVINISVSGMTNMFVSQKLVPAPEPGTLLMLGSGLVGVAMYARRKRK